MLPVGSLMGMPAPMAAAMGSSMRYTGEPPAAIAESRIALRSTGVEPQGTQMTMRGEAEKREVDTFSMNFLSIFSVMLKSAMTPSFIGRMAWMVPGVRPSIFLASVPTAKM